MNPEHYDSLIQAIDALRIQGYSEDFNLKANCIDCRDATLQLHPEDFDIDKVFRFYGPSDPDDESILYAISSARFNIRGILINGYGGTEDALTQQMIDKLSA